MSDGVNLATVLDLIPIPGVSGKETAISEALRGRLLEMGVPADHIVTDDAHKHSMYGGEVGNLIVRFPGTGEGEFRMFSTHIDTVPGAVGSRPRMDGDRIVNDAAGKSLGGDARAGVACLLAAARGLVGLKGAHPPRVLVFFVQEEVGLVGSSHLDVSLLGDRLPDMCFNFDGGAVEDIATRVIGTERIIIELRGVAAHTARIEQGISCAVIFAQALAELERDGWVGRVERDGRQANANLGIVEGGAGSNVTMPELYARGECRSFDVELRAQVLDAWRDAFSRAVVLANQQAGERGVEGEAAVSFSQGPEYKPYELPDDHPVVETAKVSIAAIGREPRIHTHFGGMDSCNVVAKGIPAVGIGMGTRMAHAVHEWIDLPTFYDACRVAADLATGTST